MDFDQRIGDARNASNQSMQTYNQYQQEANAAGGRFDSAMDNRQGYGDIYADTRNQYYNTDEINSARGSYQEARNAMDAMNTTMNNLPASVRQQYGGTGLTEAQRSRALSSQYQSMAPTQNMLSTNYSNMAADYQDLAGRAMQETQHVAGGRYQSQQDELSALQNMYATLLGQRNTAYGQNQSDRGLLATEYGARDAENLSRDELAFKRWAVEQENARSAADRNMQSYIAQMQADAMRSSIPQPEAPGESRVRIPSSNAYQGNRNVADTGGFSGLLKQGFQNVSDYGPLALFGGGSLWR